MHKASDAGHIGPHGMRRCLSFSYRETRRCRRPPPEAKNRLIFEECSMRIKHRKYRQKWHLGGVSLGQGGGSPKTLTTSRKLVFSDFLIIFDVAFFCVKIEARAKNIVNTVKKWRPGRVSSSKNGHVFDLVNILKFKMWKGGGGVPPPLSWEVSDAKNGPKSTFFWKNHCGETL